MKKDSIKYIPGEELDNWGKPKKSSFLAQFIIAILIILASYLAWHFTNSSYKTCRDVNGVEFRCIEKSK